MFFQMHSVLLLWAFLYSCAAHIDSNEHIGTIKDLESSTTTNPPGPIVRFDLENSNLYAFI